MESTKQNVENAPVVCSYNEWDLLEEVIVGVIDGACVPDWDIAIEATMPEHQFDFFKQNAGKSFPIERINAAKKELEEFVHILEAEGVKVRRPEKIDFSKPFSTPDWKSSGGLYAAMPRDLLLVVGSDIIEAPMSWRSRYFEINAYRPLLQEYFLKGAKWTSAPRPMLRDDLYKANFQPTPEDQEGVEYVIHEVEPTFDAADFARLGKDLIVQQSHVTNKLGIEWMRRHLGDTYTIHEVETIDKSPMHIDATLVPLAPGKLLANPEKIEKIPELFKNWDILQAPMPSMPNKKDLYMCSKWISMNVVSIDEKRVVVEKNEEPLIKALKDWGFEPIPCHFRNFNAFGGAFHCATLDVRRKGTLQSYF